MGTLSSRYPPPLDRLLTQGVPDLSDPWPDYLALGIGPEHVSALIAMATDEELHNAADPKTAMAPVHAWRTLAQLRAEAAIAPLISLLRLADSDDWVCEDLPKVLGMIGPAAVPALTEYLSSPLNDSLARSVAVEAMQQIGEVHPDTRAACVAAITRQLERFEENHPELNAFLMVALLDWKVVEAAPLIERAFAAQRVDETVVGDWEDVQVELGLKAVREHPRRPPLSDLRLSLLKPAWPSAKERRTLAEKKKKRKRKIGARSRRFNRRHKR